MSKFEAFKCDKCNKVEPMSKTKSHKRVTLQKTEFPETQQAPAVYDLCESCTREFDEFMDNKMIVRPPIPRTDR